MLSVLHYCSSEKVIICVIICMFVYMSVFLCGCWTQRLKAKIWVFGLRNMYPHFQKRSKYGRLINLYFQCKNIILWNAVKIKWQFDVLSSSPYCFRRIIRNVTWCIDNLFELEIWVLSSIWDLSLRQIILKEHKYSNFFFQESKYII